MAHMENQLQVSWSGSVELMRKPPDVDLTKEVLSSQNISELHFSGDSEHHNHGHLAQLSKSSTVTSKAKLQQIQQSNLGQDSSSPALALSCEPAFLARHKNQSLVVQSPLHNADDSSALLHKATLGKETRSTVEEPPHGSKVHKVASLPLKLDPKAKPFIPCKSLQEQQKPDHSETQETQLPGPRKLKSNQNKTESTASTPSLKAIAHMIGCGTMQSAKLVPDHRGNTEDNVSTCAEQQSHLDRPHHLTRLESFQELESPATVVDHASPASSETETQSNCSEDSFEEKRWNEFYRRLPPLLQTSETAQPLPKLPPSFKNDAVLYKEEYETPKEMKELEEKLSRIKLAKPISS